MNAIVDIILPLYQAGGREKYLALALNGILSQTYPHWKLYIVDDCSPVDVTEMLAPYLRDRRVSYTRNKSNILLPATLNVGHNIGDGDWCFWNTDDDWKEPQFIENMLDWAISHDLDFVHCYDCLYDENLMFKEVIDPRENKAGGMSTTGNMGMGHLYTRGLYEGVFGYDEELFAIEDLDFWRRIQTARIGFLPEHLSNAVRHPLSVTYNATKNPVVKRAKEKFKEKWL